MPVLLAPRDKLFQLVGKRFSDDEFDELCFAFGIELDDITSERKIISKETGSLGQDPNASDEVLYKIEIPANRFDLISTEGLAIALRVYLGLESIPNYRLSDTFPVQTLTVHHSVQSIRPYIFSAILRDVTLDDHAYDSFIKLQDKLHQTIARQRSLVSMGTHDYDTIKGPFSYEAWPRKDINFIPLNQTKSISGENLLEFYESDLKIRKYTHLLKDFENFPLVLAHDKTICSLPPLINSEHSKISTKTKNILIDVTAIDAYKGETILKILVCAFSYYCKDRYSIEPVQVIYPTACCFGKSEWILDVTPREYKLPIDYFNRAIGINLSKDQVQRYLYRMLYSNELLSNEDESILVNVPLSRTDVLHPCDIMEDVAIGYGFNNIEKTIPKTSTISSPFLLNKLSDHIRLEMALSGYTETLTLTLCSREENATFLKTPNANESAVHLSNPQTIEYQVVRTSMLPGLLKTIHANRFVPLPIKLFEIGDIVVKDSSKDTGSRNERHLCALYCDTSSSFETIHGALDHIMNMLQAKRIYSKNDIHLEDKCSGFYCLDSSSCETYFPGRRADIVLHSKGNMNGAKIGTIGIIHPEVTKAFEIPFVVCAFEINAEVFL